MKKIYSILIVGTLLLAGISCKKSSQQQQQSNNSTPPIEVYTDDPMMAIDPETKDMTIEERAEYMMQEAPDEGLSKRVYEQLEMPGEIVGKREVILMKSQFAISFNLKTLCPNYVCWRLNEARTKGDAKRASSFIADNILPAEMQVTTRDYTNSGYDRGHMCPAADNKNSNQAMLESFYMTNVCPQKHDLNDGDWNELEELCREWARDYGNLYICCGPIFDSDNPKTIGNRKDIKIAVPDRFFKVVLMMGRTPRAIGFIFPNEGTRRDLRSYAVSVDKVEKVTGIDFFPALDDETENKVESECKPADWNI